MDQFVAELRKIPPVTRFMTVSAVSMTIPVLLNLVSAYNLVYFTEAVVKKLQIWRLYTSYFLGSSGINFIFELVMLYRMSDQLESGPYASKSADYAWQLTMAAGAILVATRPLGSFLFLHPLLACLGYVSSRLAPAGSQTSIMGLISVPVSYFPFVMVGMDLLMAGPKAAAESMAGIIVGHGWWWTVLGGGQLGNAGGLARFSQAPRWLATLFGETRRPPTTPGLRTDASGAAAALRASGVEVVPPRNLRQASSSTGHSWGQGERLGT